MKLPALIGDDMVVQRARPVPVWGRSEPAESISVALGGHEARTVADADGRWKVELEPMEAGGPYELTIRSARETVTVRNVAVGDIWVCSGQSNMAWKLALTANGAEEVLQTDRPMIRLFRAANSVAGRPQEDVAGHWAVSSPAAVNEGEGFSAVGYLFGRDLHETMGVPIGLIHSAWGGTPVEAWMPRKAFEPDRDLQALVAQWDAAVGDAAARLDDYLAKLDQWRALARKAESEGRPMPAPPLLEDPRLSHWRAAGLYNAMIAPLTRIPICGAIWYQGESNVDRADQYARAFPAMIRHWRSAWGQGEFPFLFVQLPNFGTPGGAADAWAYLREAQLKALDLPNTGMAVVIDVGDPYDIHPQNKQPVAARLALAAKRTAYGLDVVGSGPIYESMSVEGGGIRLRFRHVDGGLVPRDGKPLKGFVIAGEDRRFVPAQAGIEGDTVLARSAEVPKPVAVRYGWADCPICNLCNGAGLPASPFRTDGWPRKQSGAD